MLTTYRNAPENSRTATDLASTQADEFDKRQNSYLHVIKLWM